MKAFALALLVVCAIATAQAHDVGDITCIFNICKQGTSTNVVCDIAKCTLQPKMPSSLGSGKILGHSLSFQEGKEVSFDRSKLQNLLGVCKSGLLSRPLFQYEDTSMKSSRMAKADAVARGMSNHVDVDKLFTYNLQKDFTLALRCTADSSKNPVDTLLGLGLRRSPYNDKCLIATRDMLVFKRWEFLQVKSGGDVANQDNWAAYDKVMGKSDYQTTQFIANHNGATGCFTGLPLKLVRQFSSADALL